MSSIFLRIFSTFFGIDRIVRRFWVAAKWRPQED